MASLSPDIGRRELTFADKLRGIQWGLVLLIAAISRHRLRDAVLGRERQSAALGVAQMTRFAIALVPMIAAALIDIRHWFRDRLLDLRAGAGCWSSRSICAASSGWGRSAGSISASSSCSRRRS